MTPHHERRRHLVVAAALAAALVLAPNGASAERSSGGDEAAPPQDGQDDFDDFDDVEGVGDVEVVTDEEQAWAPENRPRMDRAINVLGPRTTRAGALLLSIDHRTWQAFTDNPLDDFLGFDAGGLKIGLGVRFGVLDGLDVGLYRLNNGIEAFDVYELDVRWQALRHDVHELDLGLRVGGTWFAHDRGDDATGTFVQLTAQRELGRHLTLGTGAVFHSESTNDRKTNLDDAWSLAVPVWTEVHITPSVAWKLEAVFNVGGYGSDWPSISTSFAFHTHRHSFSFVVSNTQYISADGLAANTWRGFGDLIIGFSILREIQIL